MLADRPLGWVGTPRGQQTSVRPASRSASQALETAVSEPERDAALQTPGSNGAAAASAAAAEPSTQRLTREDLTAHLAAGCTPRSEWLFGTEHEKLGFSTADGSRMTYEQIQHILNGLCTRFGWQPIMEGANIIGAKYEGQSVTLEPGGQLELSGAPLRDLQELEAELGSHLQQVTELGAEVGVRFTRVAFDPVSRSDDVPWMPKQRYRIMRAYMPTRGRLGHDMMKRSTTVQVNVDYESEADMVQKMRVGLALQPVATALFANSPFREGAPSGYLSWRSHAWSDTDPDRTGMLPFVFDDGFSFDRYAEYALDVPMYFVYRHGTYIDASGQSFRDFMQGRLPALPGEYPSMEDWVDHLSTIFPEVRLKKFILEQRGGDVGDSRSILAFSAFWVGLLYDAASQEAAWHLVRDWSAEERQRLRDEVPKTALKTPFRGSTVKEVAQKVVGLAREGLQRRGLGEEVYLEPIEAIAASGTTLAEDMLEQYHGSWGESVAPLLGPDFQMR